MKSRPVTVATGLVALVGLVVAVLVFSGESPSTWRERIFILQNNISGTVNREPAEFDFLVFGHLYGSPGDDDEVPAHSITEKLDDLLALKPEFMVSLGDMVFRKTRNEFSNLQDIFLSKLDVPFYNTPGNHDVGDAEGLYHEYFGTQTYQAKPIGPASLIFLDTEHLECELDAAQKKFLQEELEKAISDPQTRYILVFMHKTLVFQDLEMRSLKSDLAMPNVWKCQKKDGSNPLMEQYFKPAAGKKPVVIFAGDVGAWGNLSPYYQRDPWLPLTLVMTGLGDTEQDNVIRVQVSPDSVTIHTIFLDGMREESVAEYDRTYWMKKAFEK